MRQMMLNKDVGLKELNKAWENIQHIQRAMIHREKFFTVRKNSLFFSPFSTISTNLITSNDMTPFTKISNLARLYSIKYTRWQQKVS